MKTFNLGFFRILGSFLLFSLSASVWAGVFDGSGIPILPPSQVSIVGLGMGNAGMADGTQFNATSSNPALLGRAPGTLELLQLGFHISNDDVSSTTYLVNAVNNGININFNDLTQGLLANNASLVNPNLGNLDNLANNIMGRKIEFGASDNLAVKFAPNFGIQIYETAHMVAEVRPGGILGQLTSIPVPYTSGGNATITTTLDNAIQSGINSVITPAQQTGSVQVANDITNVKNGTLSAKQFGQQVATDLANTQGVTLSSDAEQTMINTIATNLIKNIAYANALAYSDTVAMATVSFDPLEDFPLTVGLSGKVVRRYFAWSTIAASTSLSSDVFNNFQNDLEQPTTRWGVDLGLLYSFEQDLSLGISFQDLVKQSATIPNASNLSDIMYSAVTDPAPTVTNIGLSWHPIHEFVVNADLDDIFSTTSLYYSQDLFAHFKLGSSVNLAGIIYLRGGLDVGNFVGGAGLQLGFLGIDYSYGIDPVTEAYNHYGQLKLVF